MIERTQESLRPSQKHHYSTKSRSWTPRSKYHALAVAGLKCQLEVFDSQQYFVCGRDLACCGEGDISLEVL